jgi:hypothetical protein
MPKANKPGPQSQSSSGTSAKAAEERGERGQPKPRVGGTAVPGAKSTQPREISTPDPQRQQYESFNRQMRRRLRQMKAGPYTEAPTQAQRYRKRLEKRRKKIEEGRQEVKKLTASAPREIKLGRRLTYFLIAVVVALILAIVLAVLWHFSVL